MRSGRYLVRPGFCPTRVTGSEITCPLYKKWVTCDLQVAGLVENLGPGFLRFRLMYYGPSIEPGLTDLGQGPFQLYAEEVLFIGSHKEMNFNAVLISKFSSNWSKKRFLESSGFFFGTPSRRCFSSTERSKRWPAQRRSSTVTTSAAPSAEKTSAAVTQVRFDDENYKLVKK